MREDGDSLNDLVKRAKNDDKQAFVELMELYKQRMYKIAITYLRNDEDAADAIQDTILTCYEKIGCLKQNLFFGTWMTRILINHCKDILQKRQKEMTNDAIVEQEYICKELDNYEFEELMQRMDEKYRLILLLYYGEGFKIREIAEILDMDENTVKTRLARGRKQFADVYFEQNKTERSKIYG